MPGITTVVTITCVIMIGGFFFVYFNGVSLAIEGLQYVEGTAHHSSSPIDDQWVQQFIYDTNQYRPTSSPLVYKPSLDNFSWLRYQSMVSNYEISHYGFQQDVASYFGNVKQQVAVGEVVYFPSGSSPESYMQDVETNSPIHWNTMIDSQYHYFGYYIGSGPTYQVDKGCTHAEVPGPNINMTEYFTSNGCSFTVTTATWLVLDFSS